MAQGTTVLVAPVSGVVVPLEDLPDPVFAGKLLGEGLSVDPTEGLVVAPCAGRVVQLHRARHALTLESEAGFHVLVHVGLDTVRLGGKGFTPRVAEGDSVEQGQPLIEFDMASICEGALSAQVEVVVTQGADKITLSARRGLVSAGVDEIFSVQTRSGKAAGRAQPNPGASGEVFSLTLTLQSPNGMHARPAAHLVRIAKSFDARVELVRGTRRASATSVADIMSLDLERDAEFSLEARGSEADAALQALAEAVQAGLGEDLSATPAAEEAARTESHEGVLGGVPASPGLAIGWVKRVELSLPDFAETSADRNEERRLLDEGVRKARQALRQEQAALVQRGDGEKAQIFLAHEELLDDEKLLSAARSAIDRGRSAPQAVVEVMGARIDNLGTLKNALLRQRAADLKDLRRRVIYALLGREVPRLELSRESILVVDDLTPSVAASFDTGGLAGIVTELGGSTSHAAIIARSLGIPYVAGLGAELEQLSEGRHLIVDGAAGTVVLDPSAEQLEAAAQRQLRLNQDRLAQKQRAHERALTLDGFSMEIAANVGSEKDTEQATENGADGVGLLRSEFLFMHRRDAPTEQQQREQYVRIARALGPERSLVLRTLDVGGDKPLAYMPLEQEENPFLGVRGLRVSLHYPELFRTQIRAALGAADHTKLHLMFPMVAQLDEFQRARDIVHEEMHKLKPRCAVDVGIMVEVPSAALNASWFAKEADFFSIGTNDLTQYTLAMDRGHPELSKRADAFDPAVLRLISMTVEAAHAEGKWVGVCGGLAAERLAVPLLVGLQLDELSVPAPAVPGLKASLRALRLSDCQALAEGALSMPTAARVRALLEDFLR